MSERNSPVVELTGSKGSFLQSERVLCTENNLWSWLCIRSYDVLKLKARGEREKDKYNLLKRGLLEKLCNAYVFDEKQNKWAEPIEEQLKEVLSALKALKCSVRGGSFIRSRSQRAVHPGLRD